MGVIDFKAKAVLLTRISENNWQEKEITLHSSKDIIENLSKKPTEIEQVNIDKYKKIFYAPSNIENYGCIVAKIKLSDGNTEYMSAPLLLVECNDEQPISISNEVREELKSMIQLY